MQNMQAETMNKPVARVESDLESLIPSFLGNRQKDLIDLKNYLATGDFQNVERIGHILKGVSASYGFDKLGEYGARLETSAKKKDLHDCEDTLALMGVYMRDVVVVFE